MKTKLNELLEFPCPFTYKVMGIAEPQLVNRWLKWYSAMLRAIIPPKSNRAVKATITLFPLPLQRPISIKWKRCMKN